MFSTKKTKESLEKAQELQSEYDSLKTSVREMKDVSDRAFHTLDTGNGQLEKGLEELTDSLQERSVIWGRLNDKAAAVYSRMEKVSASGLKTRDGEMSLKNCLEKVKKVAGFTDDIKTRCGQLNELEEKGGANWEKQFGDNRAHIVKMQETAGRMTVLALNAAVEAGKLGGAGKEFLQAAEEVRLLSEKYIQMLEALSTQINEFQEFANREKELRMVIVNGLLKKMESTAEWQDDIASLKLDVQEEAVLAQLLKDQRNDTKRVADGVREACESYGDILEKLEELGQYTEENRQAKNLLMDQVSKVFGKAEK